MGELQLEQALQGINLRHEERKQRFVEALAAILPTTTKKPDKPLSPNLDAQITPPQKTEDGAVLLEPPATAPPSLKREEKRRPPAFITIDSEDIALDRETAQLAKGLRVKG